MVVFVKYYRLYRFNFVLWWHCNILTAFWAAPQVFLLIFSPCQAHARRSPNACAPSPVLRWALIVESQSKVGWIHRSLLALSAYKGRDFYSSQDSCGLTGGDSRCFCEMGRMLLSFLFALLLDQKYTKVKCVRSYPPTALKNSEKLCGAGYNAMP
jgi:hypothetical protein